MADDDINIRRNEFVLLQTSVGELVKDVTNLRIDLAVLKTKVAMFSLTFGAVGTAIVETFIHLLAHKP